MMVPSNRLLAVAALILTPALALLGLGGPSAKVGLALTAAITGLVLLDAVVSLERLRGLRAAVDSPVHAIVGRPFKIDLRLFWSGRTSQVLKLEFDGQTSLEPIALPPHVRVRARGPRGTDGMSVEGSMLRVQGTSRILERGRHALPTLHAQTNSRLGLWWMRRTLDLQARIHAYPDLFADRRLLATQRAEQNAGATPSRAAGRGRDFERLRDYVPGDELDDVHWRATAKRRRLITKLYQIEKDQRIYVAVDQSRLSARASPRDWPPEAEPLSLLERYISAALVLGAVAQAQGDQFGLLGFSDTVDCFLPAGSGPAHYRACREASLELRTRRVNADYRELFSFVGARVRRRSMLLVLTSTDDPALCEELIDCSRSIASRHLVVAAAVRPVLARPLSEAMPVSRPEEIADRLAAHLIWSRERQLERRLGQNGIQFLSLEHENIAGRLVSSYARVKRGQRL